MVYSKQTWRDGPGGTTPIDAAHLSVIEQGISDAHDLADPTAVSEIAQDEVGAALVLAGWTYNDQGTTPSTRFTPPSSGNSNGVQVDTAEQGLSTTQQANGQTNLNVYDRSITGVLSSLATTTKVSVAAAINEVVASIAALRSQVLDIPLTLAEAKTYTTRSAALVAKGYLGTDTTRFFRIVGGASKFEWPNQWLADGRDVWDVFPGLVVRNGGQAICNVATANSAIAFPSATYSADVTDGDQALLFLSYASTTSGTAPAAPTGYTLLGTFNGPTAGNAIVSVYQRSCVAADAGTTVTPAFAGNTQRLATTLVVVGGVATNGVVAPTGASSAGTSHPTPTYVSPAGTSAWLTFVEERSSTPSAYSTAPTGTTLIGSGLVTGSGSFAVAVAISLPTYYAAGVTVGGAPWTTTNSSTATAEVSVSVGLVPA